MTYVIRTGRANDIESLFVDEIGSAVLSNTAIYINNFMHNNFDVSQNGAAVIVSTSIVDSTEMPFVQKVEKCYGAIERVNSPYAHIFSSIASLQLLIVVPLCSKRRLL